MKRALFAVAVGVVGLTLMGCATDVEDPIPPAPAPEEQRDPPRQAFSAQLRDPQGQLIANLEGANGVSDLPAQRMPADPPIPVPQPFTPSK